MSGETVLGRDSDGRVREYQLATQDEVDDLPDGGPAPAAMSRFAATAPSAAIGGTGYLVLTWPAPDEVVGTDISADGTLIEFAADGIYSVTVVVTSSGTALYLSADSNPAGWGSIQAVGALNGSSMIAVASMTYFAAAESSIAFGVNGAEGDSVGAILNVQRVA